MKIAEKCMAASPGSIPNLQNVANELRLLLLIANRGPRTRRGDQAAEGSTRTRPVREGDEASEGEPVAESLWDETDAEGEEGNLTDQICPMCESDDVHWSTLRSPLEKFLDGMGIPFYRCHRCFHRYMMVLGVRVTRL